MSFPRGTIAIAAGGDLARHLKADFLRSGYQQVREIAVSQLAGAPCRDSELLVVIPHRMRVRDLRDTNEALYRRGIAWMPVTYDERTVNVGPTVIPGQTPCYECFLIREYERHCGEGDRDPNSAARRVNSRYPRRDLYSLLSSLCIQSASRFTGGRSPSSPYALQYTAHATDGRTMEVPVVSHPLCPTCAGRRNSRRVVLRSRQRIYSTGGFRSMDAEETMERCRYLVGELGPVLELRDDYFCGLSVHGALGPLPINIQKRCSGPSMLRYTGKGSSEAQSAVSAIAEAIERTCACFTESMVDFTGTRNELGNRAVDIRELVFNMPEIDRNYNDQIVNWTRAWSLTEGGAVLVPAEFASVPSYSIGGAVSLMPVHTTNGFAAGNNLEEAILQGLLEVIERHNMWLAQRVDGLIKKIRLSNVRSPLLQNMIASAQAEGMEASLYLISRDIAIPTVTALLCGRKKGVPAYSAGFGCHLDPDLAIERALTEAIQMHAIQMDVMANHKGLFDQIMSYKGPTDGLAEDDAFYYSLRRSLGRRFFRAYLECDDHTDINRARRFVSTDIRENIRHVVNYLSKKGCKVYVIDRSVRNYYFRVAKVIVTTLQPPSNLTISKRFSKYRPLVPAPWGGPCP